MEFLDNVLGKKKEKKYLELLAGVSNPLMDKIDTIKEKEVGEFFKTILDAAERSLRGILFMAPEEFNFKKQVTKEDIEFWLRKVSLALISYSCYFYDTAPEFKKNQELTKLTEMVDNIFWQKIIDSYNQIFNENISRREIDYYASGLKEDVEKGYFKSGNMEKVSELTMKDYKTISSELLQKIWKEDIKSNERKGIFLGVRIWQEYQQIVQPFLTKLLNM